MLAALPDKHRAVVTLVDIEGPSYQQAADALGVPRGTVMSRLHRARARIRDGWSRPVPAPREGDVRMLMGRLTRSECSRVARVMQSYLDGEVDPPTAATVTAHLEFCRRCGLEASTYRAIKTAIAAAGLCDVDAAAIWRLRAFAADLEDDSDAVTGEPGHRVAGVPPRADPPTTVRSHAMTGFPRPVDGYYRPDRTGHDGVDAREVFTRLGFAVEGD